MADKTIISGDLIVGIVIGAVTMGFVDAMFTQICEYLREIRTRLQAWLDRQQGGE